MSNEEQERDEKATDYKEEDAEDAAVDPEAPAYVVVLTVDNSRAC